MQALSYEGHFYTSSQSGQLPERQKPYIKVLDEPEDDDDYDYSLYFTEEEIQNLNDYYTQRGEVLVFGG